MKAAEHEIKGGMAFLDCRIVGLRLPLMALIRYRGHCFLAESIIPVGRDSLVYGSKDGGVTIHADNPLLNEKIRLAAMSLNLKAHRVWNRARSKSVVLHTPIDLEGHSGRDGQFYGAFHFDYLLLLSILSSCSESDIFLLFTLVIDTARVFPPVAPLPGSRKGSYLFKLFRPEFVRRNPVALSSDAYSKFGKDAEVEHNSDVLDATIRLEGEVVPEFARYLDLRYADGPVLGDDLTAQQQEAALLFDEDSPSITLNRNPHRKLEELSQLVAEMHLRGINVRYALAIHSLLTTSLISKLLLTEVVARSAKHIIDDLWRGLDSTQPDVYYRETAHFFSTLFSLDSDSAELWNSVIAAEVDERFGLTLRLMRTPDMPLTVDPIGAPQGFLPLRSSGGSGSPSNQAPPSLQSSNESSSSADARPSGSLRTSNPRNQIRVAPANSPPASLFNSLNSDTSLNAVDGNLLRKGIDPTLLLFRICQLCGIELDFAAWNLQTPPSLEVSTNSFNLTSLSSGSGSIAPPGSSSSISRAVSSSSLQSIPQSSKPVPTSEPAPIEVDDASFTSMDGSQEDSLASVWLKVDFFLCGSFEHSLSSAASLGASLESDLNKRFPTNCVKRIVARSKYLNRISYEEGTALSRLALSKTGQESFDLLSRANRKFHECLEIKPDDSRALLNWALVLTKQAELLDSSKSAQAIYSPQHTATSLWKEAFNKYERALVLRPNDWRALTSWGTSLSNLAARSKDGSSLYRQAIEKFDRALRLLPMPHFQPLYNAANARLKLARLLLDELRSSRTVRVDKSIQVHRDASELLATSITGFQSALEIEGTNVNAMHNLAVALATQARIYIQASSPTPTPDTAATPPSAAAIAERDRLYRAAYLVYQRAIHLMPNSVDIYYGWGNALFRHALAMRETSTGSKDDNQSFTTMCSAAMRYHAAIMISQTDEASFSRDIFINFGNVLMLGAKLSARLRATLPPSFMACCTSYLKIAETPLIYETEHASITQVLVALKRYVPKDPSESMPPATPTSLNTTQKSSKPTERVNTKASELLSQMGASDSDGSGLSGSGGNYDHAPSGSDYASSDAGNTRTRKKRRGSTVVVDSKVISAVSPSPSSSTTASTSSSSPTSHAPLTRKKSAKTVVLEHQSAKEKKISPKLDLPRSESPTHPASPPLSPTTEAGQASPTSPTSITADAADSIGRAARQGTTSKLRQKIGSFFGKLKGSSSSITPSPSTTPPPTPSPVLKTLTEPGPISPKGSDSHSRTNSSLSASATQLSASATQLPAQKSRSKKKPMRSFSYAEDDRPRAPSASSNSSSIVTSSASSGKHERAESDVERQSPSIALSSPIPELPPSNSPLSARESRTSELMPVSRSRRRSDADSQPPLRRQLTTTGITNLRASQSSPLTQSSPQISRAKIKSGGDYSSLNNETIHHFNAAHHAPPSPSSSSSPPTADKDILHIKGASIGSSVSLSASGGAPRGSDAIGDDSIGGQKKEDRKSRSKHSSGIKKEKSRSSPKASPSANSKRKSASNTSSPVSRTTERKSSTILAPKAVTPVPSLPTQLDWSKQVLYAWDGANEVKESDFVVRGVLGTSRAGLVFAARKGDHDYAMKVRHPDAWQRTNKPKLAPLLDHPFVVRPRHLFVVDSKLVMTWSLVRGPQLLDYVDHLEKVTKAKQQPVPTPAVGNTLKPAAIEFPRLDHLVLNLVTAQLVSLFCYLSEIAKMPYREFKPSNVLINDTGNLVVTAHMEEDQATLAYARADVSFLSPEIVLKIRERRALAAALGQGASKSLNLVDDAANRVEDERAMWWTLGMYLLVLATGNNPLKSEDTMKMEENVVHKKLVLPLHLGKFSNLLAGLLDRDITSRLCTPDQVRKHPYFHNMDWNKLVTLGYHPPFLPNISSQQDGPRSVLSDSSTRSMGTTKSASLNSSSLETSLDLSSTLGSTMSAQIALMNTMVMPDIGNQLEGNTAFIQNTSMIENDLCASSSASESDES